MTLANKWKFEFWKP